MINAEDCFVDDWNDMPWEFTDKAIVLFPNKLQSCIVAAGGLSEHCLNTELGADIYH